MDLPMQLSGGLVLRRARPEDAERLAAFNGPIHGDDEAGVQRIVELTLDLVRNGAPSVSASDFTLVEDPRSGQIVSSLFLSNQNWSYAGIPFKAGQPESVGTLADYRGRGLVRAQMDTVHAWSRERGHLLQGITGIPNFYRKYGYDMAVDLDGGRAGHESDLPRLADGQSEPVRLRAALLEDIPFLSRCYDLGLRRSLLAGLRSAEDWHYELTRPPASENRRELLILERPSGEPLGFIGCVPYLEEGRSRLSVYELLPGVSWLEVTPTVLRALWARGQALAAAIGKPCHSYGLWLGEEHPAYVAAAHYLPRRVKSYAWFMRIPDLTAFLWRIAPALERRLEESVCAGHTGELWIGFYGPGLLLRFERGRLAAIENRPQGPADWPIARFPTGTFTQLILGYRSLDEIEHLFPDCAARREARVLLEALFPRQTSNIWPVI